MLHFPVIASFVVFGLAAGAAGGREAVPPKEVKVLPVFFVPDGQEAPTAEQVERLTKHLEWSRKRYAEMLPHNVTFAVAEGQPRVYRSKESLAYYRAQPENSAPHVVAELLADLKVTRFNCPYVLLVVMMNPHNEFPVGGGRPLNGGFNTGGGIVILSSFAMDRFPNFQATLQHELGHGFGLPHVDVYGYDMKNSASIMSYNPAHATSGMTPSKTPGTLNPEDLWGLSLNQRAFPGLQFDPERDVPLGYKLAPRLVTLGPMTIPGQPDGVAVSTSSGEELGGKVANVVRGPIAPSRRTGKATFDASTMWHSARSPTAVVAVRVEFPYEVELTRIAVHSEHSGQYHAAKGVRVSVEDSKGKSRRVATAAVKSADDAVNLPKTSGRVWHLEFQAGGSGCVVLRGLRFFSGDDNLFPPLMP
jgi:hypothetical protein